MSVVDLLLYCSQVKEDLTIMDYAIAKNSYPFFIHSGLCDKMKINEIECLKV
jgi:hypothetical protein